MRGENQATDPALRREPEMVPLELVLSLVAESWDAWFAVRHDGNRRPKLAFAPRCFPVAAIVLLN